MQNHPFQIAGSYYLSRVLEIKTVILRIWYRYLGKKDPTMLNKPDIPFKYFTTAKQYDNAKRHWRYLINAKLSGDFDMDFIVKGDVYSDNSRNLCGACGDSIGYIKESLNISVKADYSRIQKEYIGIPMWGNYVMDAWNWCFASEWKNIDNTPVGAGIRLAILFESGLPDDAEMQLSGRQPISYIKHILLMNKPKSRFDITQLGRVASLF
jgi:hypothetical protein